MSKVENHRKPLRPSEGAKEFPERLACQGRRTRSGSLRLRCGGQRAREWLRLGIAVRNELIRWSVVVGICRAVPRGAVRIQRLPQRSTAWTPPRTARTIRRCACWLTALQAYALWIAPMLAAGAACFFAARYRAPALWPIIGSILIAFLGAATNASFHWSPALPKGAISAGIGFPGRGPAIGFRVLLTLITILVPFLWVRRRESGAGQT
jgi:hypothetical protein